MLANQGEITRPALEKRASFCEIIMIKLISFVWLLPINSYFVAVLRSLKYISFDVFVKSGDNFRIYSQGVPIGLRLYML